LKCINHVFIGEIENFDDFMPFYFQEQHNFSRYQLWKICSILVDFSEVFFAHLMIDGKTLLILQFQIYYIDDSFFTLVLLLFTFYLSLYSL